MRFRISLLLLAATVAVPIGCQSAPNSALSTQDSALLLSANQKSEAKETKGRSQLWSQTCNRCHNARSPDSYNAHEWAVVMTHMRVRGYLTGEEQRAILEFLQSQ